jgi:predicted NBD/HSP70 family sugar kinase
MLKRKILTYVNKVIADSGIDRGKILGLGIAIPGTVDPAAKIVTMAPEFGIQDRLDISVLMKELEEKSGLPIVLERDVYAAAIGEFAHRKMTGDQDLLFIFLGTGAGAGMILDGKLRRSGAHMAGEIGYLSFDLRQKLDTASLGWLEKNINEAARQYKIDEKTALSLISDHLILALSALSISLDIGEIVLGGPEAKRLGPPLYDLINSGISSRCLRKVNVSFPVCKNPALTGLAYMITEGKKNRLIGDIDNP